MFDLFKLTATQWNEVPNMLIAQLRGWGFEGDDENAEPVDDAPFMQQLGIAVFPIVRSTLRGLGWRHGDEVWMLKVWDKARKLFDMEKGETRMYAVGEETTRIRLKQDSTITVEATSIQLGRDAALAVARKTDTTDNGTLSFSNGPAPHVLRVGFASPVGGSQHVDIAFTFVQGTIVVQVVPSGDITLHGQIASGSEVTKCT